jgi:hypothetical protein
MSTWDVGRVGQVRSEPIAIEYQPGRRDLPTGLARPYHPIGHRVRPAAILVPMTGDDEQLPLATYAGALLVEIAVLLLLWVVRRTFA